MTRKTNNKLNLRKKALAVLDKNGDYKMIIKYGRISPAKLPPFSTLKTENLLRSASLKEIKSLSDSLLQSYHQGLPRWVNAICTKANGYNQQSTDLGPIIEMQNNFLDWHNTYNWPIQYDASNPYNMKMVADIQSWWAQIENCLTSAENLVFSNCEREVNKLETMKKKVADIRKAFENGPNENNSLKTLQTAHNDFSHQKDLVGSFNLTQKPQADELGRRAAKISEEEAEIASTDDIDRCRQEYIDYKAPSVPGRNEFTKDYPELNFSHYSVAIITDTLLTGIKNIKKNLDRDMKINSAYRNPKKQVEDPTIKGKASSRHCYGDAVDLDAGKDDKKWEEIAKVACKKANAVWVEPLAQSTNSHVHADWRPGGSPDSSYCQSLKD